MPIVSALFLAISPFVLWPYVAGIVVALIGRLALHHDISQARGWEKVQVSSRLFYAVPLAVFAGDHLRGGKFVPLAAPPYSPCRLFWPYFVEAPRLAAALG